MVIIDASICIQDASVIRSVLVYNMTLYFPLSALENKYNVFLLYFIIHCIN